MGCVDKTSAFRTQVKDLARLYPPPPSRKGRRSPDKSRRANQSTSAEDGFLTEAYAIVS